METEAYQFTLLDNLLCMGPWALLLLLLDVGCVGRSLLRPPHPSATRRATLVLLPIVLASLLTLHTLHSHIGISGIDSDVGMRMALWEGRTLLGSGLLATLLTFTFTTLRLRAASHSAQ